jgi:phosphoribosyl 1,2-cyclic phosphodiesterase|tara:strand:- start:506 stop:955 length:450 start_codon:yes stop_codon:yes gene_type:complete
MINDIKVTPIPVPHDAREPFQFMVESNLKSMAIITDLGHITNYIIKTLKEINALVIEFNHDKNMLINSDYPQSLKDRVSGIYGHLENMESIKLLESINYQGIEWIAAAHLSEKNNDEKLVKRLIADVTKKGPESIKVIDQINGIDWLDI